MTKKAEGMAEIVVYFETGVPDETKVTFIKYVHEHLLARAQDVTRVRTYVCPHCDAPVENRRAIQDRLIRGLKDIVCVNCEKRVPLLDLIEEKFASDEFLYRVQEMERRARINLDKESRELILVGHSFAVASEAGQTFRLISDSPWGYDGEIEFSNPTGQTGGRRVYLKLMAGDSISYKRRANQKEIITITNWRHAEHWRNQSNPVLLVTRTPEGSIEWMNLTQYLLTHGKGTEQIVFDGEPFTAWSLLRLQERLIREDRVKRSLPGMVLNEFRNQLGVTPAKFAMDTGWTVEILV